MSAVRTRRSAFQDRLPLLRRTGCGAGGRRTGSGRRTGARPTAGRSVAAAGAWIRRSAVVAAATTASVRAAAGSAAIRPGTISPAAVSAPAACLCAAAGSAGASGCAAASGVCTAAASTPAAPRTAMGTDARTFRPAYLAGRHRNLCNSASDRGQHLVFRSAHARLRLIHAEDCVRQFDYSVSFGRRRSPERFQSLSEICRSGWPPHVPGE